MIHYKHPTLIDISKLRYNWNNNRANKFNKIHLSRVNNLLIKLGKHYNDLFIAPTACNSIQLEFDNDNKYYLEFEMNSKDIKIFTMLSDGTTSTEKCRYTDTKYIIDRINKFYRE